MNLLHKNKIRFYNIKSFRNSIIINKDEILWSN